jgi:biotin transporter BioY
MAHQQPTPTWADYRKRARLFWLLLLVGPIATLAAGAFWLVEHVGLHGLGWPLAAWLVAVLLAARHWQSFRCPRCERGFFNRRPLLLPLLANRCVHCLLSRK